MSLIKETVKGLNKVMLSLGAAFKFKEQHRRLKGELFLKVYEKGNLVYEYQKHNIIVNTASILIARLLKDNKEPTNGISYLAVGSGSAGWNPFDPPAPTTSQTLLENEFERKAIELTTFVNPETGEPTTVETNIVDYSVTFGEADAVGPIMEMGLFGGDATSERNTGCLVNHRTFPVINKTNSMTLTIIFRITT
jgi:hypothetical protein